MRVVARPARNAYGPYGLAVGRRADGARCLYAWQWIDAAPVAPGGLPVSLRVRLCRSDASLDALASAVDALRLADPATGGALDAVAGAEPAPPLPRRSRRRAPTRLAAAGPSATEAAPVTASAPVATPPAADGRRYLAAPPVQAAAIAPISASPAPGGGALDTSLPPEAFRGPARR